MNVNLSQIANNFTSVNVNGVRIWFSYETAIAFSFAGNTVVRENVWGVTTGKHLNRVDGGTKEAKAARFDGETFEGALRASLTATLLVGV